jgi:SHS2 domain-containing protein
MGGWQHFAHGADVGVRGTGRSEAEAFANAAVAMTAVVTDPATVRAVETIHVECSVPDRDLLFCEWLNALIFEMATRHMLFSRFDVRIEGSRLMADASGERVDVPRHGPAVELKGATLTELAVRQDERGEWSAQCVLDV